MFVVEVKSEMYRNIKGYGALHLIQRLLTVFLLLKRR